MTINAIQERLQIEYPCKWLYKVIGTDPDQVRQAVLEAVDAEGVTIDHSHTSSGGRYVSFNVEVLVHSDEQRIEIYEALRAHAAVTRVL